MRDDDLKSRLEELFSDAPIAEPKPEPAVEETRLQKSLTEPPEVVPSPSGSVTPLPSFDEGVTVQTEAIGLQSDLGDWRERLVITLLRTCSVLGLVALIVSLNSLVLLQRAAIYIAVYLILLAVTLPRRLPYLVRTVAFLFLAYGLGLSELLDVGLLGDGSVFLLALPILAAVLLGWKAGAASLGLSVVTLATTAWAISTGLLTLPYSVEEIGAYYSAPADWFASVAVFGMLAVTMLIAVARILRGEMSAFQFAQQNEALRQAQAALKKAQQQQEAVNEQLRQAVVQSTRRTDQLHAAAEVSRAASSVLEPETLIHQTVNLIRDRFDYYYVGLFLLDPSGRWAVLKAGTGEAGRKMLTQGHELEVGGNSMVGWCTAHGQARIARDVGEESIRFDNPLLPETRSEMALPLISRGRVIGALTVQGVEPRAFCPWAKRPRAFSDEDISVLQTMADQVANAIENARLLQETERLAHRNQLVSEVSVKLRSALDLEGVLRTTVRELGLALGASEAVIRLGAPASSGRASGDGRGESEGVLS